MASEQIWLPLVDEPIGELVRKLEEEDPEIGRLVDSADRLLAFRTFAYIRVGLVLGQLLVEHEVVSEEGVDTWVEQLIHEPEHRRRIAQEVRGVAEEVAADARYAERESVAPDDEARMRFREFARKQLESR